MSNWLAYAAMAAVLVPLVLMGIGYLVLPRRQSREGEGRPERRDRREQPRG